MYRPDDASEHAYHPEYGDLEGGPPTAKVTARQQPFDPMVWTARLVLAALALTVAVDVVGIVSDVSYHRLIQRIADGADVSDATAQSADDRQARIGEVQLGLFVATSIVFLVWFQRAYRNLWALGVERTRWGTGWAVGGWFVPFLNFVRPKSIANDIWRGSDPDLSRDVSEPRGPVPLFHSLWWLVFIADGLLARFVFQYNRDADTFSELLTASNLFLASDVVDVVAAVLAAAVVYRTVERQRRRAAGLAAA